MDAFSDKFSFGRDLANSGEKQTHDFQLEGYSGNDLHVRKTYENVRTTHTFK